MIKKDIKKYNVCLTYGTFDMFHFGHLSILLRCKEKCNKLIVGVATDDYNKNKQKESIQSQQQRFNFIKNLHFVDKVIYEHNFNIQWANDYKKYRAEAIFIGDDHKGELDYLIEDGINLIYLDRTKGISTSDIKKKIKQKNIFFLIQNKLDQTEELFQNIKKINLNKDNFLVLAINKKIETSFQLYQFWNSNKKIDFIFLFNNTQEVNQMKKRINLLKINNLIN
ncbi:MAG: hypothetical protein HPPSJP_0460 [Candidatus Hepatoplasma scabrum]|nr:MAG: hypothetical protein HPPSJP_0460 [Candidatus Hepatoplasma sp.]